MSFVAIQHIILEFLKCCQAFWRAAGLSGEVATAGGPSIIKSCDCGPLCIVFDATSAAGNPAIVSFIGGNQQINYSCLSVGIFILPFLLWSYNYQIFA